MRAAIVAFVVLPVMGFVPALAQVQPPLPLTTPSERQLNQLNNSLSRQIETRQQNQNFQFQLDQLRSQQQQFQLQNSPAFRSSPTCPAGSIGC